MGPMPAPDERSRRLAAGKKSKKARRCDGTKAARTNPLSVSAWFRRIPIFLAFGAQACAAYTVPPGLGDLSEASKNRLNSAEHDANLAMFQRACTIADRRPDDERMQLKAASLAASLARESPDAERAKVLAPLKPTLLRLEDAAKPCVGHSAAAEVHVTMGEYREAAALFSSAARACKDVDAAIEGAHAFRNVGACDAAVALIADTWSFAPSKRWMPMFDAVNACSDAMSLRENLSFAPPEVLADYFALLDARAREEEQRRREEALAELAARRESERRDARFSCESYCNQSETQCRSGCTSAANCSMCGALRSHCLAGCQ